MPRGYSLVEHLDKIKAWAQAGILDDEIGKRLGAHGDSIGRLRRLNHIRDGREILLAQLSLKRVPRTLRPAPPAPVPEEEKEDLDPEAQWKRLLAGRRFNEPGMVACK